MLLHRLAILIAVTCLGPGPGGDRSPAAADPSWARPPAVDLAPSISPARLPSPHANLSRIRSWRHRIKSVLEDKVAWCPRPVDRGPLEAPNLIHTSTRISWNLAGSRLLVPLRC